MKKYIVYLMLVIFLIVSVKVYAQESYGVVLRWDAQDEIDLEGFNVYVREVTDIFDFGNPFVTVDRSSTSATVTPLLDGLYAFVVTAFDTHGNESDPSNEIITPVRLSELQVIIDAPPASPTGCYIYEVFKNP